MELIPSRNALLNNLHSGVVHDILTCWLELKSVCKLDTAYCTIKQRARLIELCQDKVVVFTLIPNTKSRVYIHWIAKRKLQILKVEFPVKEKAGNERICNELLISTGIHLKELILPYSFVFNSV